MAAGLGPAVVPVPSLQLRLLLLLPGMRADPPVPTYTTQIQQNVSADFMAAATGQAAGVDIYTTADTHAGHN